MQAGSGVDQDIADLLAEQVRAAAAARTPLRIEGGGSKAWLGREVTAGPLAVAAHRGIVHYEPTELVITARAGTPLAEVEAALEERGQMLPFEPPRLPGATIGGAVATGLSGPRRPWAGAARDAVLGVRMINGRGEVLRFGGEVMKNVAGYDVSRLLCASHGTLGVLLEVSLRVMPRPAAERTVVLELGPAEAIAHLQCLGRKPLGISAAAHIDGRLWIRLCGGEEATAAAGREIGGDPVETGSAPWEALRDLDHPALAGPGPLWRWSVPFDAPVMPAQTVLDWAGAQRWGHTDAAPAAIREGAARLGGHATLFRGHDGRGEPFTPLPGPLRALTERVKRAFDPFGILNPGRMYPGL